MKPNLHLPDHCFKPAASVRWLVVVLALIPAVISTPSRALSAEEDPLAQIIDPNQPVESGILLM